MKYNISLINLGEFRMGVNGYGISILFKDKQINFLSKEIIFANSEEPEIRQSIDEIKDENIIVIRGAFSTYLIDLELDKASLYRHTIRSTNGAWSEECPIYGNETYHFNGKTGRHYYVQFPFVPCDKFLMAIAKYEKLRLEQINHSKTITTHW